MLLLAEPILAQYHYDTISPKTLAIVLVGNNPSSELYVAIKTQKAEFYGVNIRLIRLAETTLTNHICQTICELNSDRDVDAIIIQLPLPKITDTEKVLDTINPAKDVDNLTGKSRYSSPMVQAIGALIDHYKLPLEGKTVCVVGHGRLVGQPIVQWLQKMGINPTIIESPQGFNDNQIRSADVVIAGTGSPYCINAQNTREGQIIFDCSGTDVDFASIKDRVYAITPPKGAIGPLTVHFLLRNVLQTT